MSGQPVDRDALIAAIEAALLANKGRNSSAPIAADAVGRRSDEEMRDCRVVPPEEVAQRLGLTAATKSPDEPDMWFDRHGRLCP